MTDDEILRILDGEGSEAERQALVAWRRQSPEHERRVRRLLLVDGAVRSVAGPSRTVPRPSAGRLLRPARRAGVRRRLVAAAAVAAVAAAVMLAVSADRAGDRDPGVGWGLAEVTTGPNEASTTRLADGSIVHLAPGSRLRIGDGQQGRGVWLEGTAFFAVAHRKGDPFVVRTAAGTATVLGTRFELRASSEGLRLVVVEGRVALRDAGGEVLVSAGEVAHTGGSERPAVATVADPRAMAGWLGRVLLFQDTPLRDVAREVEDQYGMQVMIVDSALARHLVTGAFPEQPAESVLAVVCQVVGAVCTFDAETATIRRKD
jgi:transmembrane sensor